MVQAVQQEGPPEAQGHHWVALGVDGDLVQATHLCQGSQLGQTANVGLQEDKVLWGGRGRSGEPLA